MSANVNVTNPDRKKKVLLIAANPATSPTTGWPVGFWWAELTHPYWAFTEAGYEVEIRSPAGGALAGRRLQRPRGRERLLGRTTSSASASRSRPRTPRCCADTQSHRRRGPGGLRRALRRRRAVADVHLPRQRDARSSSWPASTRRARSPPWSATRTCLLLETKLSSGDLLVEGKTWTGFANSEEQFADGFVGKRIQPFWIEDEARKIPGTNFVVDQMFREFAVRDGRLVTGQQQYSGAAAARLVIEALGR